MTTVLKVRPRQLNAEVKAQLEAHNIPEIIARIVAGRPLPEHARGAMAVIDPRLADLDAPDQMQDMDVAVSRILKALEQQEVIALETDHDCDGQTSHAVLYTCFTEMFGHPKAKIQSFIGHRMEEGYGLSEALMNRILAVNPRPTLVITADNGSSDEPRIEQLKGAGIDVIVTDHHHLPESGPPKSACAVLNPTREDCVFPDPYIAGCMVAWLLMASVRRVLLENGQLSATAMGMKDVLDFVAVGTVADCVSLARSVNNRAVVRYGLQLIAQAKRPCWQAILPLIRNPVIRSEDLAFTVAPLLNSDGRLSDALGSVNFLLAESCAQATDWAQQLWAQNQTRKEIQKALTSEAMQQAALQVADGKSSIVVMFSEGHAGVHGISASRIKDQFGRPTILFSTKPNEPDTLSGSARSIDELHMRDVLQQVADQLPEVVVKFGGHSGAAGLTITKAGLASFTQTFEQAVNQTLGNYAVGPVLYSDGLIESKDLSLQTLQLLQQLDPYGREFDAPLFELQATVESVRKIGQDQTHAQLTFALDTGQTLRAVWFQCCESAEDPLPVAAGQQVTALVTLSENHYQGQVSLQLQVKAVVG